MKPTTRQMLKAIVLAMLAGGWKENHELWSSTDRDNKGVDLIVIRIKINTMPDEYDYYTYSFPDLLLTLEAMKAVFGDSGRCTCVGSVYIGGCSEVRVCQYVQPAHEYHAKKAFELSYNKGIDAGVGYLYGELIKNGTRVAANAEEG